MKKMTEKRLIALALTVMTLVQTAGTGVSAAYSDVLQPLQLEAVPFEETGVETQRTSGDATLVEIYNQIKTQHPTLSEDGKTLLLPETGNENYAISLYGSSNKAVIDMDCNVTQPLEDMQVYLYYRVTNLSTGEELHMDDPLIVEINGLYEDSQCSLNRPKILPGIREWKGNEGTFTFSGKLVLADESLTEAASVAKDYIEGMTGLSVTLTTGTPVSGDMYFAWNETLPVGKEGYVMEIADILTVTATDYIGIVYAGATLTQMLVQGPALPKGHMRDYPQYESRASMLDIARFYMPMDYLREMTIYSAFFKFNEFHAHINDNNGEQNYAFRVESKKYPQINGGVPADEVYSQEEYKQYQKDMKRYGIDVITEIDTPAHARFVAAYDSTLMLDDTRIDIRKPEAIAFIKSLVDEFLDGEDPVIQSENFHIGIDEYDYQYADEIRSYTNDICAYISAKGYTPRIWCSNSKTKASDIVIDNTIVQTAYAAHAVDMQELLSTEARFINDHSKFLYVVPVTVNGCNDYINLEWGYREWEAGRISRTYDSTMLVIQPGHPLLMGAESTIWYDDKVGASEFDYHSRYIDQVMLVAEKTWFGKKTESSTWEEFSVRAQLHRNKTPLANPGRYIETQGNRIVDYDFTQSTADRSGNGYDATLTGLSVSPEGLALDQSGYVTLPFRGIGFPYCMDFRLKITEAAENAILFDGRDGTLLLNYDGTGKMGIERKGYRFVFDYEIPTGVTLNFRLVCKDEKTYLYVEDALVGEAQLYKTYVETYGSTSFVVPAERIGSGITGNLYSLSVSKTVEERALTGNAVADKSVLREALEQVYDTDPYSQETAVAYERAAQMAKTVYADPAADQPKVDWAVQQLAATEEKLSLIHTVHHSRDLCPHCGKTRGEIEWEPWEFASGTYIKTNGHYYLTEDVFVTTQVGIGVGDSGTAEQAVDVVLDLNGYKFINKTARCFFVSPHCTFSVMDSVGGGTVSGGGKADLTGGAVFALTGSTFHLYGGTVTASGVTTMDSGVVHIGGGTFVMHSGLIYGGKTICEDADTRGNGGNVSISGGRFEMRGGTIAGGVSTNKGGNVYLKNSVMEMYDGQIIGGTSNIDVGGNIAVCVSTFKMYGGTIRDGYAINGGNIGNESGSVFQIDDGLITGGTAKRYGGNIMINNANAQLTINGGRIDGDMRILATMKLTGSPSIGLGGSNGLIIVPGGGNLNISGLSPDARIYVSRTSSGVFTTGYDPTKHQNCFLGAVRTEITVDTSGELKATNGTKGYCPHCGKLVQWEAWTPINNQTITEDCHLYLTAAKTDLRGQAFIGADIAADNRVIIDFNGNNFSGSTRLFYIRSELNLMDTTGGAVISSSHATASGLIAQGGTNGMLNVYSGYYTVSSATASSVFYTLGATEIHGGIIDGSKIDKEADSGALHVAWGTLKMFAGRVFGGKTNNGGAVYYFGDNDKAFDLYGGVIMNGRANKLGGNVYIGNEGVLQMRGGIIMDGTGDLANSNYVYNSDNVYVDAGRKVRLSGGYILGSDSDFKGNAITTWTECLVTLAGDPMVLNTSGVGNLYVGSTSQLVVEESFRGIVYANLQTNHLQTPYYGTSLKGSVGDYAQGPFPGKLFVENVTGSPCVFGGTDGKLWIAGAAVTDREGGFTWHQNADAAAKAAKSGALIQLYAKENTITLPGTHTVDLNGKKLTVAGGQVFCIDSANSDYKTYGKAVVDGGKIENMFATTVDGETYCTIQEPDGYSFHRLDMALNAVALRPGTAGVYYKVRYACDPVLAQRIGYRGIAMSVASMPTENFENEGHVIYTKLTGMPNFTDNAAVENSCILNNILTATTTDENDENGRMPIYARPYIAIDKDGDGTADYTVVADTEQSGSYSLLDILKAVDGSWANYESQQQMLKEHYATWKTWNVDWDSVLPNFVK